ncbi:MAG: LysE family transporter [Helicobacteraceae bacterium]|nr:LysE family transporter [Helicobacteraceae bacterium]
MEYLLKGFLIAFSLFAAIGAQNIFVIKQGIIKNHIFWVCFTCIMCDIIFVSIGIFGVAQVLSNNKIISIMLGIFGAIFISYYALNSLKSAINAKESLNIVQNSKKNSLKKTITQTLLITLLNPHVYLDTIIILGAIALPLDLGEKIAFEIGIIFASCSWFLCIGYASNKAHMLFKNPKTWAIFNAISSLIMFYIAFELALFSLKALFQL